MFEIIEPQDHRDSQSGINSFLGLLKVYQSFSLDGQEKEQATFIIGSDHKRGVYGGALLYPQNVGDLYKNIGKVVSTFQPERQRVWVARVGLYTEHDDSAVTMESLDLQESFYKNLLKAFRELGEKKDIDLLVLKLCSSEFYQTKRCGYWPYILEIRGADSSDDLFHGILSLTPRKERGI